MDEAALSYAEAALARATDAGEKIDFGARRPVIRAGSLRRMLLGLPVTLPGETAPRAIRLYPPGLRLRGARIKGPLDLDDAAGTEGGPLPPLVLENCVIPDRISLRRARLRHLSLAGSRLTHLDGAASVIAGTVDLSNIASAEAEEAGTGAENAGLCWIEFPGARIEGGVSAPRAKLAAPPVRDAPARAGTYTRYALDLRDTRIEGGVTLWPDVTALGGIRFSTARIGGDIIGNGATLTAIEGYALSAQGARIDGNMLFSSWETQDAIHRFQAAGSIWLLGAKIGGTLEMGGASIQSLAADNTEIGGDALLRAWEGENETIRFEASDDISLPGAKIGGTLEMNGASIESLVAHNAEIGGAALLRAWEGENETIRFEASDEISLLGAKIGGPLDMGGASIQSLVADNTEIGGAALLRSWQDKHGSQNFEAGGPIKFLGVKIKSDLDLDGAMLRRGLNAHNAEIGGNLRCGIRSSNPFTLGGDLSLSGARIASMLIVNDLHTIGDSHPTIDLTHARIGVLDDGDGTGWGEAVTLRLEGFEYGRLVSGDAAGDKRLDWLKLQYQWPKRDPTREAYAPDAYDRLTRAFRTTGNYDAARAITRERLRVECRLYTRWYFKPFIWLYDWCSDFGMSPSRAIGTFVGCILVLCGLTSIADHGLDPAYPRATIIGSSFSLLARIFHTG